MFWPSRHVDLPVQSVQVLSDHADSHLHRLARDIQAMHIQIEQAYLRALATARFVKGSKSAIITDRVTTDPDEICDELARYYQWLFGPKQTIKQKRDILLTKLEEGQRFSDADANV